jgi:hypothetical protein
MNKAELDRRCAEMKARLTAGKKAGHVERQIPNATAQRPSMKLKRDKANSTSPNTDLDNVGLLSPQIAKFEAENKRLRQQVAALTSSAAQAPGVAGDSVREQQHNFFKYSNARRY